MPLRSFFTASVRSSSGRNISSQTVKQRIRRIVDAEDAVSPLSDEEIRDALETHGIAVSRRTVAKYRAALGIPPSDQRKKLK